MAGRQRRVLAAVGVGGSGRGRLRRAVPRGRRQGARRHHGRRRRHRRPAPGCGRGTAGRPARAALPAADPGAGRRPGDHGRPDGCRARPRRHCHGPGGRRRQHLHPGPALDVLHRRRRRRAAGHDRQVAPGRGGDRPRRARGPGTGRRCGDVRGGCGRARPGVRRPAAVPRRQPGGDHRRLPRPGARPAAGDPAPADDRRRRRRPRDGLLRPAGDERSAPARARPARGRGGAAPVHPRDHDGSRRSTPEADARHRGAGEGAEAGLEHHAGATGPRADRGRRWPAADHPVEEGRRLRPRRPAAQVPGGGGAPGRPAAGRDQGCGGLADVHHRGSAAAAREGAGRHLHHPVRVRRLPQHEPRPGCGAPRRHPARARPDVQLQQGRGQAVRRPRLRHGLRDLRGRASPRTSTVVSPSSRPRRTTRCSSPA